MMRSKFHGMIIFQIDWVLWDLYLYGIFLIINVRTVQYYNGIFSLT